METLTFGEVYGRWLDSVAGKKIAGHASLSQVMTMAAEAGIVLINGNVILPTFKDHSGFKVELTERGPVIVVPRGAFPELDHYAAVDGVGGEMLRYE